jgi:hypothetical protein
MSLPAVAVLNPLRPLRKLEADGDSWETWVDKAHLPNRSQDVRGMVDVRLSTGEIIKSKPVTPGIDLPGVGAVPE